MMRLPPNNITRVSLNDIQMALRSSLETEKICKKDFVSMMFFLYLVQYLSSIKSQGNGEKGKKIENYELRITNGELRIPNSRFHFYTSLPLNTRDLFSSIAPSVLAGESFPSLTNFCTLNLSISIASLSNPNFSKISRSLSLSLMEIFDNWLAEIFPVLPNNFKSHFFSK